jgi:hypothetical protein
MKFTRQQIKVAIEYGKPPSHEIPALVAGSLAVHGSLIGDDMQPGKWLYNVTHIPSGLVMAQSRYQRRCRELVTQLNALAVDWDFTGQVTTDSFHAVALPVLREFLAVRE